MEQLFRVAFILAAVMQQLWTCDVIYYMYNVHCTCLRDVSSCTCTLGSCIHVLCCSCGLEVQLANWNCYCSLLCYSKQLLDIRALSTTRSIEIGGNKLLGTNAQWVWGATALDVHLQHCWVRTCTCTPVRTPALDDYTNYSSVYCRLLLRLLQSCTSHAVGIDCNY